jgi:2,4-dienoyl-CoA reductase-like NADH-dependent reductase (Old Yellow Enzyme family)
MPSLFDPFALRSMNLRNRIVMSPMCMYMAGEDARAADFHLVHLGVRALGGVGLIITEATAVETRGRISPNDLGLYSDQHVDPLARIVSFVHSHGAMICTQLAHAGRKAWSPTKGRGPEQSVAPSAVPFDHDWVTPRDLAAGEIDGIVSAFRQAAQRAQAAGFDAVEIHGAHGYLLHEFLSPLANHRSSLEKRMRLLLRVVEAVRAVWPPDKPMLVRLSCTDWVAGGLTIEDIVQAARALKERSVDLIDCSTGGVSPAQVIPLGPGYQVPFAERVRREAGIATGAVGLVTSPEMADEVICNERADVLLMGRELLRDPHWPLRAARQLGVDVPWPVPYHRAKR